MIMNLTRIIVVCKILVRNSPENVGIIAQSHTCYYHSSPLLFDHDPDNHIVKHHLHSSHFLFGQLILQRQGVAKSNGFLTSIQQDIQHFENQENLYMAPGTDAAPSLGKSETGFCKENEKDSTFDKNSHEESDDSAQAKASRPPLMRHCSSHVALVDPFSLICSSEKSGKDSGFQPTFRSGSCSEIGPKQYMEDEFICVDDLPQHIGTTNGFPSSGAFYGVFDGHGGKDAASFTRKNILKFITEDSHFPDCVKRALKNAFVKADHALADSKNLDQSSGTTALVALVLGRTMIIANAGDSRAVLGKRGRAIELSKDHKPNCTSERLRIEKLGGVIYDGYLNGQLSVARALGDWHMKGDKGSQCPLSSEPELEELVLTEEDEFLIIGCDGLWDVMSSQYAVTIVRKELMVHNDPERCSKELVREALKRNTCDNLTVVLICFSTDPPPRIEIPRSHRRRSISAEGLDILKDVLSQA